MQWYLDKSKPVCPQICEQVCLMVALGNIKAGGKMFSVRETAVMAGVNPNTVQKAFEQLEQDSILFSVRGSGWFVCEDTSASKTIIRKLICDKTKDYFDALNALGMSNEEIKNYVREWEHE